MSVKSIDKGTWFLADKVCLLMERTVGTVFAGALTRRQQACLPALPRLMRRTTALELAEDPTSGVGELLGQ